MFRSAAPRATPQQPAPSDTRATTRGRHHRAARDREDRERQEAVKRARRRASQVGAWEAVSGPLPITAPAQRSTPAPETAGPPRIDSVAARQDPLTRPFPSAPNLPGARRSPSAPMQAAIRVGSRS
jgi:hypothetical protein